MLVKFSPQRADKRLEYEFEPDIVKAKLYNGHEEEAELIGEDTFDFSDLEDGEVEKDEEGNLLIETTLPELPILHAERWDGELAVIVRTYHDKNAPESERFPEPLEVE